MTKSDSGPLTGEQCQTMSEVREGVDALDREIVALLVRRQAYMSAAARIKGSRDAVYDGERIEDVVAKVVSEAQKAGLSPNIAEPVWRELIARCIDFEFAKFDALRGA
nr:chorismate mutase [Robiginitomaculum antarcticum]